jgi:hypothetical protein
VAKRFLPWLKQRGSQLKRRLREKKLRLLNGGEESSDELRELERKLKNAEDQQCWMLQAS